MKPSLIACPPGFVRTIFPLAEPEATTADILVGETIVNEDAALPPKLTPFTSPRLAPVINTLIPAIALCGRNEEITGGKMNRKPSNELEPPRVETTTLPSLAPSATYALIWVAESTLKVVTTLFPILTVCVVKKFVPFNCAIFPRTIYRIFFRKFDYFFLIC